MAKKRDAEMRTDEVHEDEGTESRVYELGFHLDPELPTEEVKKTYQSIREQVARAGSVVAEGEPEKLQLAYTISRQGRADARARRDFDSAYFSWIAYEAPPAGHADVISAANAEPRVIRFIDLVTTKEAARHAIERRVLSEKAEKAPERAEAAEAAIGAELDAALENVAL